MNSEIRYGLKYPDIGLLANARLGIVRPGIYEGGKISDAVKLMRGKQDMTEAIQVQPFVGSALDSSIVEVESIYVDIREHGAISR